MPRSSKRLNCALFESTNPGALRRGYFPPVGLIGAMSRT